MAQNPGTSAAAGGGAKSPAQIEREIDALQSGLASLRDLQSRARTQTLLIVVVIVALFGIFMFATWSRIKGNFNDVAVQKAVQERAADFLPRAADRLGKAVQNAAPTYQEVAMARLQVAGPQIAADAQKRLEKVPQENAEVLRAELQTTFDKVAKRIEPDVKTTFPSLTDDRRQAILADFHQDVDAENQKIKQHVDSLWQNELNKLHAVMSKFNTSTPPGHQKDQAEREFLHAMIMYVDFLITAPDVAAAEASKEAKEAKDAAKRTAAPAPATQASSR